MASSSAPMFFLRSADTSTAGNAGLAHTAKPLVYLPQGLGVPRGTLEGGKELGGLKCLRRRSEAPKKKRVSGTENEILRLMNVREYRQRGGATVPHQEGRRWRQEGEGGTE